MNSDIINTPYRVQRGLVVTPWEFTLFKQLSGQATNVNYVQQIDVTSLFDAYKEVMNSHELLPASREWIIDQLENIKLTHGMNLIDHVGGRRIIKYQEYNQTLKWFMSIRKHYGLIHRTSNDILNSLNPYQFNWQKHGPIILTSITDVVGICIIILAKIHLPIWLIIARSFAVIILLNIFYILVPCIGISSLIPDDILARGFPTEYSDVLHVVCGIKILIASVLHTVAHIMQIQVALHKCANGCTRKSIRIVPHSHKQIIISYQYFFKQFPYVTGVVLVLMFAAMLIMLVLYRKQMIRYSTNRMTHQYLAFAGILMTIIHGCEQLLGLNYSFIFTVPIFTLYCWQRRHIVVPFHIKINRWVVTPTTVRLYLRDNKRFDDMLKSFANVIVYANYPRISKTEWHPFTLARGYNSSDATITMKRVGAWTNELADVLLSRAGVGDHINISHFARSKFRFHRLYKIRYFFCAGVGITAFIAAMSDTLRVPTDDKFQTVLVWSVADIDIVIEFGRHLIDIQSKIPNVKILIFYSNRAKATTQIVSPDVRARFAYLQAIIFGSNRLDIVTHAKGPICILFQRADFIEILSRATISIEKNNSDPVGIFVCGPRLYADRVGDSVDLIKRNKYGIKFRIWTETV